MTVWSAVTLVIVMGSTVPVARFVILSNWVSAVVGVNVSRSGLP